jgi:hypothetical protein
MVRINWKEYACAGLYDELVADGGVPRPAAQSLCGHLAGLQPNEVAELKTAAEVLPMPLRPSSVRTSPAAISNETPNSTALLP